MFPLLGAQNNIYAFEKRYPNTATFQQNLVVEIRGIIQPDTLKRAIVATAERHDALRSYFTSQEAGVFQSVRSVSDVSAQDSFYDITFIQAENETYAPPTALRDTLTKLNQAHLIKNPFSLTEGPLWRAVVVQWGNDCAQFLLLAHHLIIDESSLGIILNDITAFYNAFATETLPSLPTIPSMDVLSTLHEDTQEIQKRLTFWKENLSGLNIPKLPTDHLDDTLFQFNGKHHRFTIDANTVTALKNRFPDQTMNNLMLGTLASLMARYTQETDLCLGITSANRRHPGKIDPDLMENHVVNCFFNSLPVRLQVDPDSRFETLLSTVKTAVSNAAKNQLPLDTIFEHGLSRDTRLNLRTASPFNVLIKTYKNKPTLNLINTTATHPIELDLGCSKFTHYGISVDELTDGSFQCFIEYNTDLYQDHTIERLAHHFTHFIQGVSKNENTDTPINTIPLLSQDELSEVQQYNATERILPFKTVSDHLHEIATVQPNLIALYFHNDASHTAMTYGELDLNSTRLANVINALNLPIGTAIGVCLTRSPQLLVASFAVFKAGLTLVTIENKQNNKDIIALKSSALTHVITDRGTDMLFEGKPVTTLNLEADSTQQQLAVASTDYHAKPLTPSSSVYTMYTSGTTGTPKAVGLTHGGFSNLLNWLKTRNMSPNLRVICTALPTFDAFYYDALVVLATCGELHLTSDAHRYSPEYINQLGREFQLQFGAFLPDFLDSLDPTLPFSHFVTMGASPHADNLNLWINHNPSIRIENGLGHTETGICLMQHPYNPKTPAGLIGQPLDNMSIHIIDPHAKTLCPIGIPGELYVAGPGVAIGYLNQPELSQTKFMTLRLDLDKQQLIPCNPDDEGAQRMYATGDYGCYRYDQEGKLSILFIGRKDRQMKINGVRIELDGIEQLLRTHPDIKEVVVLPNEEKSALRAYIEPTNLDEMDLTSAEFRINILKHFSNTLFPMVGFPREVILLDSIPTTVNGKVDTKALSRIPTSREPDSQFDSHENPVLAIVVEIWSSILGLEPECMSIKEPIWAMGGNSINSALFERLINSHPGLKFSAYLSQAVLQNGKITLSELASAILPYLSMHTEPSVTPFSLFTPGKNTTPPNLGFPNNGNYDIQSRGINNKPNH